VLGWMPSPIWMPSPYEDQKTAEFIRENFFPVKAHIKEHPAWFHRFDAVWTPTVLLLDSEGKERVRLEGYLPNNDFVAALRNGRASLSYTRTTPMRNDGTATWSPALGIPILHRRRCTGGPSRTTRQAMITRCWAKSPMNFEARTRRAFGRAKAIPWLR
jgi:hypothetical protein